MDVIYVLSSFLQVGTVSLKEVGSENLTIAIDGKPVVGVNHISKDCFVMVGEGKTIKFGPGNVNVRKEKFDIRFLVNKHASMVGISVGKHEYCSV